MKYTSLIYKAIGLWVFLLLAADIKVSIHPQIHWGATLSVFILALPLLLRLKYSLVTPIKLFALFMSGLLVASVLLVSFTSENPSYGLSQSAKLSIILLGAFPLLLGNSHLIKIGISTIPVAVFSNLILLILGLTASPVFAQLMTGDNRWGTFFNYPGSLWRVGILVIVLAAYALLQRRRRVYYALLLAAALTLIYFDSSRTGALLLFLAFVFSALIILFERRHRLLAGVISIVIILAILGLLCSIFYNNEEQVRQILPQRVVQTFEAILMGNYEEADHTRYEMLQVAQGQIQQNPLWGTGIGNTRVNTNEGPIVVHNAYLQVWADLGIMGLIAYTGLVIGWFIWVPSFFRHVRQRGDPVERGLYYNAVFILFFYAFSGLFHPLSTEWSEWITFILPYALFARALSKDEVGNAKPSQLLSRNLDL
ncbi:O-antigen ligase [Meiothermus sp.]|uniref:O-antigen ligase family protein n=1 Tax=Meiothermus sp. TaxID=1955249 RepID=UPI002633D9BF|nr:O-antigen ligase family protein [Meiothermus sp.]